jgi:uncharacterized protein (TIGR02145 family)
MIEASTGSVTHPAANACFEKNSGYASITEKDDLVWYLPAQKQLMAAWVSYSSFSSTLSGGSYWSATEDNGNNRSSYAWLVSFSYAYTRNLTYKTNTFRVRCVRELN